MFGVAIALAVRDPPNRTAIAHGNGHQLAAGRAHLPEGCGSDDGVQLIQQRGLTCDIARQIGEAGREDGFGEKIIRHGLDYAAPTLLFNRL